MMGWNLKLLTLISFICVSHTTTGAKLHHTKTGETQYLEDESFLDAERVIESIHSKSFSDNDFPINETLCNNCEIGFQDSEPVMGHDASLTDNYNFRDQLKTLCDDCEMDYEDPETKQFQAEVEESNHSKPFGIVTKLTVLAVIGAIVIANMILVGLFLCFRKGRSKRDKKSERTQIRN